MSTRYPFEQQVSKLYTRAVFNLFKVTLLDSTAFIVNLVSENIGSYTVSLCKSSNKNPWSQHAFKVSLWEHTGL